MTFFAKILLTYNFKNLYKMKEATHQCPVGLIRKPKYSSLTCTYPVCVASTLMLYRG